MDRKTLISILQQPAAYDHPVEQVQFRETHISLVFLTGEFVYKIKKSVDFGFLDFSSLEKRKHYCEEEIRLNGRLAPQLYLEVVPICGDSRSARIGGTGPAIEYAIKMRQFDTHQEFNALLLRNELSKSHIDEAAEVIADFHSTIAIAREHQTFSTPEVVQHFANENFDQIAKLGETWLAKHSLLETLRCLQRWTDDQNSKLAAVFAARKESGFVRECHGDLHLRNIVVYDDKVTPFDGIEFNDQLRWIDVMSDIAFLLMDLEDHGRFDLSRRLRNQYLSSTGDYAGLAVLRYYLAYRAMVRAKVAGLKLLQSDTRDDVSSTEIENYIQLAAGYTQHGKAKLIISHGLSGSGKTFLSQMLLEQSDIIRIRSDVERKRLFNIEESHHNNPGIESGLYSKDVSRQTYDHLLRLSDEILKAGYSVLVDAAFLKKEQRQLFCNYANSLGVPFLICHSVADIDIQRQRLEQRARRGNDASDANIEVLEQQLRGHEPISLEEEPFTIGVDTNGDPDLSQVVSWLEATH
ncbi:MAG: AAA family ATPase [Gammaproteobacteria bacterium]|nr:AAA family ATPase [Gammaproteobacteria bacterium]